MANRTPSTYREWDSSRAGYREYDEPRRRERRFEDRALDDRTGAEPGSAGGYPGDTRAERGYEERSFRPGRDYPGYDRESYRPEHTPSDARWGHSGEGDRFGRGREYYYPETDYGGGRPRAADMRDNDYRSAMAQASYGAAGYPSGIGPNFGFGGDLYDRERFERDRFRREGRGGRGRDNDRGWWDRASDEVASWFGDEEAMARREADHRPGGHAGRGPKGYRRSDGRIEEEVCERLSADDWLDASEIEVKVEDREVTLDGKVASRAEKRRAEMCAERVSGVEHVQNNLRVDSNLHAQNRGGAAQSALSETGSPSTTDYEGRGRSN